LIFARREKDNNEKKKGHKWTINAFKLRPITLAATPDGIQGNRSGLALDCRNRLMRQRIWAYLRWD
jgi:hypothetical protein